MQVLPSGLNDPRQGSGLTIMEDQDWDFFARQQTYQCRVLVCPDEEAGGFSVHSLRLPGVVSEGETVEEALRNIAEAFQASIEEYRASGDGTIPWEDNPVERVKGCFQRWILVNV